MRTFAIALLAVMIMSLPASALKQGHAKLQVTTPRLQTRLTSQKRPQVKNTVAKVKQAKQPVAPVAAPTPPPEPVYPASCAAYEPLVAQYDWDVQVAMAIMQAESGCDPYQVSPASINWDDVSDYGLFQLHGVDIMTPADNVSYAYYHKYVPAGGFTPWSTYNSGKYRRFM